MCAKSRFIGTCARTALVPLVVTAVAGAATLTIGSTPQSIRPVEYRAVLPVVSIDTRSTAVGFADSDLYGMSPDDVNRTLDELQALGVGQIRVFVPWAFVEPLDNIYSWVNVDKMVDAAEQRGMAVLAVVTSTPVWASDYSAPNSQPRSVADYADFVGAMAERYGADANNGEAKIAAYEIWNEPNYIAGWFPGVDPEAYTELLVSASTAIKDVDPSALVIAAGLGAIISTPGLTMSPVTFVERMYAAGAKGSFDALAFHPYQYTTKFSDGDGLLGSPLLQTLAIRRVMEENLDGDTLLWATEYGLPTAEVSEAQQMEFIDDFLNSWSSTSGTGPMFIYTSRDREAGASGAATFGVFRNDWSAKPSAAVIEAWIRGHGVGGTQVGPIAALLQAAWAATVGVANLFVKSTLSVVSAAFNAFVGVVNWAISTTLTAITWGVNAAINIADAILPPYGGAGPQSTAVEGADLVPLSVTSRVANAHAASDLGESAPADDVIATTSREESREATALGASDLVPPSNPVGENDSPPESIDAATAGDSSAGVDLDASGSTDDVLTPSDSETDDVRPEESSKTPAAQSPTPASEPDTKPAAKPATQSIGSTTSGEAGSAGGTAAGSGDADSGAS